jgi:PEP-CTERM motif
MFMKMISGAVFAAVLSTGAAIAASWPTFTLDTSASDIDITLTQGCAFGVCSATSLDAQFAAGADNFSWTPTGPNDMIYEGDFIDWEASGIGIGFFDVEVTLAFSSPDSATGSTTGGGGFGTIGTLFGSISGGVLTWNGPATINFAQGSAIDVFFDSEITLGIGSTTTTGAKFVGNDITPVPLPASSLMLLAGVGGLAAMRRRQKKNKS